MAADLHIHVMTEDMSEDDLRVFFSNALGSKWFNPGVDKDYESPEYKRVIDSPNVWIGEVSWLKAALLEDNDTFVPDPVGNISELVGEDLPIIDDDFIIKVDAALRVPNFTDYTIAEPDKVVKFLEEHRGKRVFAISW